MEQPIGKTVDNALMKEHPDMRFCPMALHVGKWLLCLGNWEGGGDKYKKAGGKQHRKASRIWCSEGNSVDSHGEELSSSGKLTSVLLRCEGKFLYV
jgi:hypothetical protein